MKKTVWLVAGVLLSGLLVSGTGFLAIQRIGLTEGAIYGLDNQLRSVQGWGPALPQLAALVVLPVAVLYLFWQVTSKVHLHQRRFFAWGFIVATTAQIVWAVAEYAIDYETTNLEAGFSPWWLGWVEIGGIEPVTMIALIVCIWAYWRSGSVTPPTRQPDSTNSLERNLV